MKKKFVNRRRSKKVVVFKPSHDFLSKAVSEYLAQGGTITRLESDEKSFEWFVSLTDPMAADRFLMGL